MHFHMIGNPNPKGSGYGGAGYGNSLAVVQFVELIRGERAVLRPVNRVKVAELVMDELYCLGCCGVRHFDVAQNARRQIVFSRCRFCGRECWG